MNGMSKFRMGQRVRHKLFDYRGVVLDIDPTFSGTDEWYENLSPAQPEKKQPWYHVLVHDTDHITYVPEKNIDLDLSEEPFVHPALDQFFFHLSDEVYISKQNAN